MNENPNFSPEESDKMEKIFKSLNEQIEILKFKGLTISDVQYAKEILLRENYFFINGYRHLFMSENKEKYIKNHKSYLFQIIRIGKARKHPRFYRLLRYN